MSSRKQQAISSCVAIILSAFTLACILTDTYWAYTGAVLWTIAFFQAGWTLIKALRHPEAEQWFPPDSEPAVRKGLQGSPLREPPRRPTRFSSPHVLGKDELPVFSFNEYERIAKSRPQREAQELVVLDLEIRQLFNLAKDLQRKESNFSIKIDEMLEASNEIYGAQESREVVALLEHKIARVEQILGRKISR